MRLHHVPSVAGRVLVATRARRPSGLRVAVVPRLESRAQVAEEPARVRAVDEAVVVREGHVHHRPDRDHVLPELVLDDPRALHDRVGAEDRPPAAG